MLDEAVYRRIGELEIELARARLDVQELRGRVSAQVRMIRSLRDRIERKDLRIMAMRRDR